MTTFPELLVLGYSEAAMLLRQERSRQISAIISIYGQREYPIDAPDAAARLLLKFDDSDLPDDEDEFAEARMHQRRREAAEFGLSLTAPTEAHALAIIEFARNIRDMEGALLCQCFAGISRSSAAALLCLAEWTDPGHECACVEHLLSIRPAAQPHRDLVRFGDKLLGREGRLTCALDARKP